MVRPVCHGPMTQQIDPGAFTEKMCYGPGHNKPTRLPIDAFDRDPESLTGRVTFCRDCVAGDLLAQAQVDERHIDDADRESCTCERHERAVNGGCQ